MAACASTTPYLGGYFGCFSDKGEHTTAGWSSLPPQVSTLQVTGQVPDAWICLPKLRGQAKPGESSGSSRCVVDGSAWLPKWSE